MIKGTHRIVQGYANGSSTKFLAIQVLDGAVRIISAEIFKNTVAYDFVNESN